VALLRERIGRARILPWSSGAVEEEVFNPVGEHIELKVRDPEYPPRRFRDITGKDPQLQLDSQINGLDVKGHRIFTPLSIFMTLRPRAPE